MIMLHSNLKFICINICRSIHIRHDKILLSSLQWCLYATMGSRDELEFVHNLVSEIYE